MKVEVLDDDAAVAAEAALRIAAWARDAVAERERFVFAISGGSTPWRMLRHLADEDLPWERMHLLQVDERVAPAGDPDRNWTHLGESLLEHTSIPESSLHPMPVEAEPLDAAAARYAELLRELAGTPPALDLVHLGLGPDGHTASLVPGDPVLDVADRDVALTGTHYQGRQRMTLTYPVLNAARRVLWLVTGEEKVPMLERLQRADAGIPGGRIAQANALVLADKAATGRTQGR